MRESIFTDHEMPEVFAVLDCMQNRIDSQIFDENRPDWDDGSIKEKINDRIFRTFGRQKLTNKECDLILKECHKNFLEMSKKFLQVDTEFVEEQNENNGIS